MKTILINSCRECPNGKFKLERSAKDINITVDTLNCQLLNCYKEFPVNWNGIMKDCPLETKNAKA